MNKLIIIIVSGMLLLATGARAEEIFLKCVTGETSNYTYINTTKKLVGEAYLQKNKKDLYIYDWIHEDVKISDKEIEYKSTMSFWRGYSPKNKNYHKIVVDRYSGSRNITNNIPSSVDGSINGKTFLNYNVGDRIQFQVKIDASTDWSYIVGDVKHYNRFGLWRIAINNPSGRTDWPKDTWYYNANPN
jgi:hypothetical protein